MIPATDLEITRLGLSTRARNALRRMGCNTLGNIVEHAYGPAAPGLGRATRAEVASALAAIGVQPPPGLLPAAKTPEALAEDVLELCEQMEIELRRWLAQVQSQQTQLRRMLELEAGAEVESS